MSNGEWARHVAHEMTSYLQLHRRMKTAGRKYDEVVWSAMRTAYGAHVRNLLEFFHCKAGDSDVCWKDLAGEASPYGKLVGTGKQLWDRASKQISHLSKRRGGLKDEWIDAQEWGNDPSHLTEIVPKIQKAVEEFGDQLDKVPQLLEDFLAWKQNSANT